MKGVNKRFFKYNIVYSVFGLTKRKGFGKKTKWKKIENGKTYFEDLELILYRCRHLKHPRATLVTQGAFWVCLHNDKSTINPDKQFLKNPLCILP